MQEKRNSRRMSLSARLLIKNLNDDSDKPEEVEIEVLDVSKTGATLGLLNIDSGWK